MISHDIVVLGIYGDRACAESIPTEKDFYASDSIIVLAASGNIREFENSEVRAACVNRGEKVRKTNASRWQLSSGFMRCFLLML